MFPSSLPHHHHLLLHHLTTLHYAIPYRQVVDYVGIIPSTYCTEDYVIDVSIIAAHVTRLTLALDIDNMKNLEYVGVKENVGEWCPRGVLRPELGYRACDMVLSILRLALRHAVECRVNSPITLSITSTTGASLPQIVEAGIPLEADFLRRCQEALIADVQCLLPLSFIDKKELHPQLFDNIWIDGARII